jgi:hypothetical protein
MSQHVWKFFRSGGFDQARLDTAADLLALGELDQKLWVALSCPVGSVAFPAATLAALDTDADGHVRAAEVVAAAAWLKLRLADPSVLEKGSDRVPLGALAGSPEGQALRAAARRVLQALGKTEANEVELNDLADRSLIFGPGQIHGNGVVRADMSADPAVQALIARLGESYGFSTDRNGNPGVDEAALAQAQADAAAYSAWQARRPDSKGLAGDAALAALAAFSGVRGKIDDYFVRCAIAAFDPRANATLNGDDETLAAISRADLSTPTDDLSALPLARPAAGAELPLEAGINPAWQARLADFSAAVVVPLLGARPSLAAGEWTTLKSRLAALAAWYDERPASPLAAWTNSEHAALMGAAGAALAGLMADQLALAKDLAAVDDLERLLHLARDFQRFCNNFVSFREFYVRARDPHQAESVGAPPDTRAIFLAGTLYVDGRSCDLCVSVGDAARHASLAGLARIYLLYCECTRGSEKRTIAAAVTNGESDQLLVGRNAVFYDRHGDDWDATIVRIVDHPISLRQAFWSPYRKLGKAIGEQLDKLAASRAQSADTQLQTAVIDGARRAATAPPAAVPAAPAGGAASSAPVPAPAGVPATASAGAKPAAAAPAAAPAAPAAFDVAKFAGIFAAIGLAVGAIGTALAAVVTGFLGLVWWQMPLALAGLILAVSGPAMLMAYFKLRRRTLGPLLDANGWAINSQALINLPFGAALTHLAKLPAGAERALTDPYAQKQPPYKLYAFLLVCAAISIWGLSKLLGK